MNMEGNKTSIDDSIHHFLLASLFGSEYREQKVDDLEIAIHRAYRDFCRTIRDKNNPDIKDLEDSKRSAEETMIEYINKHKYIYAKEEEKRQRVMKMKSN